MSKKNKNKNNYLKELKRNTMIHYNYIVYQDQTI